MAVSGSNLTANYNDGAGSSFSTASVSPTSNSLILLTCSARRTDSTQPVAPTVTGNSLTWVKIAEIYFDTTSSSRKSLFLYRALGSSPASGAVTIDYGAQTITGANWSVDEFSGIDTSGTNGSGAVVQSATNKEDAGDGGQLTVTLSAFSNTANATFGCFCHDNTGNTWAAGSGFTKIGTSDSPTYNSVGTEWRSDNSTSVDMSVASGAAVSMGGIAIEVKAASAAGGAFRQYRMMQGIGI